MGQHHLAVDIADGVDAGDIGAQMSVGLDGLAVKLQTDGLGVEPVGIGGAAHGHEHHIRRDRLRLAV